MYVLKRICFACLKDSDEICDKKTEDEIFAHLKSTLPELMKSDREKIANVCTSCQITLRFFYNYKKKCLANYERLNQYIKLLKGNNNNPNQHNSLQIHISDFERQIKQLSAIKEKYPDPTKTREDLLNHEMKVQSNTTKDDNIMTDDAITEIDDDTMAVDTLNDDSITMADDDITVKDEFVTSDDIADCNIRQEFIKNELELNEEEDGDSSIISEETSSLDTFEDSLNTNRSNQEAQCSSQSQNKVTYVPLARVHSILVPQSSAPRPGSASNRDIAEQDDDPSAPEENMPLYTPAVNTNTDNQQNQCPICGDMFLDQGTFVEHANIHLKNVKSLACPICNTTFTEKTNLKRHLRTSHFRFKDFECSFCKKKFTQKFHWKLHMKVHLGIKDLECEICNQKFTYLSSLRAHMNKHVKRIECPICKIVLEPDKLKLHMDVNHLLTASLQCEICNMKFAQSSQLNLHKKEHLGMCRSSLKTHLKIRKNNEKLECKICNQKFESALNLKAHVKNHINGYECDICGIKFTERNNLFQHEKIHKESEYECSDCNEKFIHIHDYIEHLKVHFDTKGYECELCHKKFVRKSLLAEHIMKYHTIKN